MSVISKVVCDVHQAEGKNGVPAVARIKLRDVGVHVQDLDVEVHREGAHIVDLCETPLRVLWPEDQLVEQQPELPIENENEVEGEYTCHYCGRVFSRPQGRASHERLTHPEQWEAARAS
jgi:hypothetical protein